MFLFQSSHARIAIFREPDNTKMRVFDASLPTRNMKPRQKSGLKSKGNAQFAGPGYRNSVSLTRWNTVEGGAVRKRARVMVFEIAKRGVGGTGKAIRTWAIAGYYGDVRDVSSIILIAEITGASMAPTTASLLVHLTDRHHRKFSDLSVFRLILSPPTGRACAIEIVN